MQTSVERKGKKSTGLNWYTLGPLLAAVAVAALMYLLAVLLERQILPYALVDELLIACVFLGAAIGGAAAAKKRGKSALASGLIAGAVLAALLAVGSLMAEGEAALSADCLRHAIAAVAGGLFGGALCPNRRAAKRKKRGRRR